MRNLQMGNTLVRDQIAQVRRAIEFTKDSQSLWPELHRVHRLSQPYWFCHAKVHFLMARYAIKVGARKELFVQIAFIFGAIPSSIFRLFPPGHPGTITIPVT